MTGRDLKKELEELPLPDQEEAEARAWRTVRAAYLDRNEELSTEGSTARARFRIWRGRSTPAPLKRWSAGLAATVAVLILVITPAGATVKDWVRDAFDGRSLDSATVRGAPPGAGRLLVDSPQGTWVTNLDGSKRRLGDFSDSTFSPRGLFVAAVDGKQLAAIEPGGDVRWTLDRPTELSVPSWNSPDGYRIAYLEGDELRGVAGDGTGDRRIARGVASVRPAWRPGPAHVLAFAPASGGVEAIRADTRGRLFSTGAGPTTRGLQWSRDGSRLLAWTASQARLLDPRGGTVWRYRPPSGGTINGAALEPGSRGRLALLEGGERTKVVLTGPDQVRRVLISTPGSLQDPFWSPDGKWLALGWPEADQWLFLHGRNLSQVDAVTDVSSQFAPGATSPVAFPRIRGWCCSDE